MPDTDTTDKLKELAQTAILDTIRRAMWRGGQEKVHLLLSPDMVKFMIYPMPDNVGLFTTDSSLGQLAVKVKLIPAGS